MSEAPVRSALVPLPSSVQAPQKSDSSIEPRVSGSLSMTQRPHENKGATSHTLDVEPHVVSEPPSAQAQHSMVEHTTSSSLVIPAEWNLHLVAQNTPDYEQVLKQATGIVVTEVYKVGNPEIDARFMDAVASTLENNTFIGLKRVWHNIYSNVMMVYNGFRLHTATHIKGVHTWTVASPVAPRLLRSAWSSKRSAAHRETSCRILLCELCETSATLHPSDHVHVSPDPALVRPLFVVDFKPSDQETPLSGNNPVDVRLRTASVLLPLSRPPMRENAAPSQRSSPPPPPQDAEFPTEWNLQLIGNNTPDHSHVLKYASGIFVTDVYKVRNEQIDARFRDAVARALDSGTFKSFQWVWHGTNANDQIVHDGFRVGGVDVGRVNGAAKGIGVYTTVNASTAASYCWRRRRVRPIVKSAVKRMLLCELCETTSTHHSGNVYVSPDPVFVRPVFVVHFDQRRAPE